MLTHDMIPVYRVLDSRMDRVMIDMLRRELYESRQRESEQYTREDELRKS